MITLSYPLRKPFVLCQYDSDLTRQVNTLRLQRCPDLLVLSILDGTELFWTKRK